MAAWKLLRGGAALIILTGALVAQASVSVAQDSAPSLVEEVAAHEVGDNAQVRLDDTTGFDAGGGQAVLQPGTTNAETFSYDSVDAETDRLIGLTRPEPVAHPVGALVEPVTTSASQPAPDEDVEPGAESNVSEEGSALSQPEQDQEASMTPASDGSGAETSYTAMTPAAVDTTLIDAVIDIVAGAVSDPCASQGTTGTASVGDPWVGIDFGEWDVCAVVDDIETGDPCDPNNTGQTCEQYVNAFINDIWTQCLQLTDCQAHIDQVCDPDDTAQTCEDWLLGIPTADGGGCGIVPGNVVSGGTYVEGYGTTTCTKKQKKIKALVCVERKIDGEWVTLEDGCDVKKKFDDNEVMAHATSICAPGTHKYRIWAFGSAIHYGGGKFIGANTGPSDSITCYPGIVP